jgi:hypothetical protein
MDIFGAKEKNTKIGKTTTRFFEILTPEFDRPEVTEEKMKEPPFRA